MMIFKCNQKNSNKKSVKIDKTNKHIGISDKKNDKQQDRKKSKGFYYSFLTIVLILCLIQVLISAVVNISKVISYNAKIKQITNIRDAAVELNQQLNDNINNFSNVSGLEAIARNNLKMSSEDEVMVIINTKQEDPETEKPSKNKFLNLNFKRN